MMRRMRPQAVVLAVVSGLLLAGTLPCVLTRGSAPPTTAYLGGDGPVIGIRDVQTRLAPRAQVWLGRIVLVRGIPVLSRRATCPQQVACRVAVPVLVDADPTPDATPLLIELGPVDPVLARLRAVPFLGRLAPPMQEVVWGRPAIYRLRIQRSGAPACADCVEGLVLDAAPLDLGGTGALEPPTAP